MNANLDRPERRRLLVRKPLREKFALLARAGARALATGGSGRRPLPLDRRMGHYLSLTP
jgi:hypothetical protein